MTEEKQNRGLGRLGLSLIAGLMLSGMALAQDVTDGPDIVVDDGDMIFIDDGYLNDGYLDESEGLKDPFCMECSGVLTDDGPVDDATDAGDTGLETGLETGSDGAGDGELCDSDVCQDFGGPGAPDADFDPVILYMSGAGGPLGEAADGIRSGIGAGTNVLQRGPDLCVSPAPELVWLCAVVSGKPLAE